LRSIFKASAFILAAAAVIYVGLFFAVVPLAATTEGLPRLLAINAYDALYRPVRQEIPYNHVIRKYWRDYLRYWCEGDSSCPLYGSEARGGGLFEADRD